MYIKPNVAKGSASNYDVPTSGNAGTNQLVKGDDTRLTDARNAADVTNTYSASGTVPVSGTAVASAIGDLDVTGDSSVSASKTLASWSETDGKVSITTQNISITKSQVSDFPAVDTTVASGSGNLITSGAVYTAIDNLPEPMIFKGTLGTGGTITTLPTAASSNEGFTYKVITAGTYSSIVCKIGDVVVSNGSEWVLIPAGDTDSDSWRNIKVNGTEKLTSAISSGSVDFVNGTNTTVSFDASGNKIAINGPTSLPASDVYDWAKASTKPSYAYSEISNTPTLGTASAKDVPTSGNASTTQVVMGDDTRLTDSRNAADVYSWAKASSKPSYTASEVGAVATNDFQSDANTTRNANDITKNTIGYFKSGGPSSSAPDGSGSIYAHAYSSGWVNEIAQDYYGNGHMYVRSKQNSVWGTWKSIPTMQKSTTDISTGSALPTDELYIVYEA